MATANKGDDRKLAELILYISQKCANDPTFGAVKLNKILCYSDFLFYAYHGRGITNVEYQKLPYGPAPRRLKPVRNQLIKRRALALQDVVLKNGHVQKRTVNLRQPNLSLFSGDEIALVDRVIESTEKMPSGVVSDYSHNLVGWLVVDEGETIPYDTIFFSNPPLSEDEAHRARELAAQKSRAKNGKKGSGQAA
ncbi:MAG: SocA family protein [Acidobacteriia bacterium]|nr:SocA family protein [Terriglobia bacterium]